MSYQVWFADEGFNVMDVSDVFFYASQQIWRHN
jgi:hypothetical protein